MPKSNQKNKLRDLTPDRLRGLLDKHQPSNNAPVVVYQYTTVKAAAEEMKCSIQALTGLMRDRYGYSHISGYTPSPSSDEPRQS